MAGRGTRDEGQPIQPNTLRNDAAPRPPPLANVLGATARGAAPGIGSAPISRSVGASRALEGARLPGVSGRWSSLGLLALFVLSGLVVPLALHRALWIEAEAVIGVWFVIWAIVLTALGYSGRSVEQDRRSFRSTWDRLRLRMRGAATDAPSTGSPWVWLPDGVDLSGAGEGCLWLVAALVVLAILYVAIGWVIPFIAFTLYELVRGMLDRVGAGPETRGDLPSALGRGILWAAVYTAPIAVLVWAIHVVM